MRDWDITPGLPRGEFVRHVQFILSHTEDQVEGDPELLRRQVAILVEIRQSDTQKNNVRRA